MNIISVQGITKHYPSFTLRDIIFTATGQIMGLIEKRCRKDHNLKSMINLVRPVGEIEMFGRNFMENEESCKQNIGLVLGEIGFRQA